MTVYLLILAAMMAGSTVLVYSLIQQSLYKGRLGIYDARGFYLVVLVFITFVMTSLAYFWGDTRFSPVSDSLSEPLMGVMFTLCSCLAGLAFGLIQLKDVDSIN